MWLRMIFLYPLIVDAASFNPATHSSAYALLFVESLHDLVFETAPFAFAHPGHVVPSSSMIFTLHLVELLHCSHSMQQ